MHNNEYKEMVHINNVLNERKTSLSEQAIPEPASDRTYLMCNPGIGNNIIEVSLVNA